MDAAYDFVLACVRYNLDPVQFGVPVFPDGMDLKEVLAQATHHRALGLLYKVGKAHPGLLPETFLNQLRGYYFSALLLSDKYIKQVRVVLAELRAAKIPLIVFKAWAAFPTVYEGSYGARPFADIDVLIAPEQLKNVDALLLSQGYRPVLEFWPGYRFRHHVTGATYAKTVSSNEIYVIDLHWAIFTRPYHDDRIRVADLFARATPLEVAGEPVLHLSIEDIILHTCGHLSLHHQYQADLNRFYELAWWVRHAGRTVDWQAVLARSTDWKLTVAMQRFAPEMERLFPGTFPADFMQALQGVVPAPRDVRMHDWLVKYAPTPFSLIIPAHWSPVRLWDALGVLLEVAFPGRDYLEQRYGTPRFWPLNYWRRWTDLTRRIPSSGPD